MPIQQPRKERLQGLAGLFMKELEKSVGVEVRNPAMTRAIFVNTIEESLREEEELEREVLATLRKHGQQIYKENADFQRMLRDGKKILARKKGFVL